MLNIPETIKQLFERDDVRKNFRVHFPNGEFADITNENIIAESVEFTESLCSQNNFRFGLTEASVLKFETVGVGNMLGMKIEAAMEIDISALTAAQIAAIQAGAFDGVLVLPAASDIGFGFYRVPYGKFYVESCPRNHQAMAHRQVTAYSVVQVEPISFAESMPADNLTIDYATLKEYLNPQTQWTQAQFADEHLIWSGTASVDAKEEPLHFSFEGTRTAPFAKFRSYVTAGDTFERSDRDMIFKVEFDSYPEIDEAAAKFAQNITANLPDIESEQIVGRPAGTTIKQAIIKEGNFFSTAIGKNESSYVVANRYNLRPQLVKHPGVYIAAAKSQVTIYDGKAVEAETLRRRTVCEVLTSIVGKNNPACCISSMNYNTYEVIKYYPDEWPNENDFNRPTAGIKVYYKEIEPEGITLKFPNSGKMPMPNFGDFYDFRSQDNEGIFGGQLEIAGKFGKVNRVTGEYEEIELDNTAPIPIAPGMYSEMWWDEYDISKIGEVIYKTADTDETQITVSDGRSIYDMSDNKFNEMAVGPESAVNLAAKIQAEFPEATRNCYFTPVDLTMIGAPWIEAGTALSVTADDGTIVNTFALRHTLRGVQHIVSEIESAGGNIIGIGG